LLHVRRNVKLEPAKQVWGLLVTLASSSCRTVSFLVQRTSAADPISKLSRFVDGNTFQQLAILGERVPF
jgi:hypothetical protein